MNESPAPLIKSADAAVVAEAVIKALPDVWLMRSPICTREEAMAYARIGSARSWYRFCQRTDLTPLSDGRYDRQDVERAARSECRVGKRAA